MAKLKMVKGSTYFCVPLGADKEIKRGDIVDVADPKVAQSMLDDCYTDASNNVHHYFVAVGDDEPVGPADDDEADASTDAKPAARKRQR